MIGLKNGITTVTYDLLKGHPGYANYYLPIQYTRYGSSIGLNRSYVTKAVVGHFNSIADASGASDIKDQLFPENYNTLDSGYLANYSGEGQNFTIFAEGMTYKITVKVSEVNSDIFFKNGLWNQLNGTRTKVGNNSPYIETVNKISIQTYYLSNTYPVDAEYYLPLIL